MSQKIKSYKVSLSAKRFFSYALLVFLTAVSLLPFFVLVINSTRMHSQLISGFSFVPGTSFFRNLANLFANKDTPVLTALFNSIFVSFSAALLATYFSAMTAYGIYMYNFKGKKIAFRVIMAIMMIPTQVTALGFVQLITRMHLMNSLLPLVIPAVASPVVFFFMLQYLRSSLPSSIVEASRIDGCNEFVTFNHIVFPMIKPAVAVQFIFTFVSSWNSYFLPALILSSKNKKTIPIIIAQLRSADFMKFDLAQVYSLVFIAIIPLLVIYLIFSKQIIGGVTMGGVKD